MRDSLRFRKLVLIGCVLLLAAAGAEGRTWIVLGVMNGPGANDTLFSSEITLVNPEADAQFVSVIPIGPPGSPIFDPLGFTLAPGETRLMPSPLEGAGALRIQTQGDIAVFARITCTLATNAPPVPVEASALPVIDAETFLQPGETGHAAWVAQSKDPTAGSRTNVGVVFPGSDGGSATITLFDAQGAVLGTVHDDVPGNSAVLNRLSAFTSADVPIGRIALTVTRGTAYGYVAVADSATFSLAIEAADRLPPPPASPAFARVDLLSSGVAQIAGANESSWHTDARLANPGSSPVQVAAYLVGAGQSAPQGTILLDPGKTVEIDDIVSAVFHGDAPAIGAVLWRGDGPFLVSTRTRSADLAETPPFGIHGALSLDKFLTSRDPAGQLAGLRLSGSRTNILTSGGPAGATFDLDLFDETGLALGTVRRSLPPLGWAQSSLHDLVPGVVPPARSRLQVRVENGSVGVQATVVDDSGGAPVFIDAFPQGARIPPPSPLVPAGSWGGAPNGMDHLTVDDASVSIFRPCQSGSFPQPLWLDADGRFGVIGSYIIDVGPSRQVDAVLTGHLAGDSVAVQVIPLTNAQLVDSSSETFVLGAPFGPFTGLCPLAARPLP